MKILIRIFAVYLVTFSLVILFDYEISQSQGEDSEDVPGNNQYYALLITATHYTHGWPDLSVKASKINELAGQLSMFNYHITRVVNPVSIDLKNSIKKFVDEHNRKNDKLLIVYVGHCYQNQDGNSCLIPIDTPLPSSRDGLTGETPIAIVDLLNSFEEQSKGQLLFAIDNSISLSGSGLVALRDIQDHHLTTDTSRKSQIVLSAGSADEAVPADSHFLNVVIEMLKGEGVWKKNRVDVKQLCEYVAATGVKNSFQTPWCKVRGDISSLDDMVLFDKYARKDKDIYTKSVLRVKAIPGDAVIRILNIAPKYVAGGIDLKPGRYHVEVTAPGYEKQTLWVDVLAEEEREVVISLIELVPGEGGKKDPADKSLPVNSATSVAQKSSTQNALSQNKYGFKLIKIKKGSFTMGGSRYNEGPIHSKRIENDFFIMNGEVSIKQYREYLKATGKAHYIAPETDVDLPVTNVSWQDAVRYAEWLSKEENHNYRLPTEAEWEYVAKKGMPSAGGKVKYPGKLNGGAVSVRKAWRNTLGIHGMPGNVWEWCDDCWNQRYSANSDSSSSGKCGNRVIRGGSWRDSSRLLSPTSRNGIAAATKADTIGFRLVMED